MKRVFLSGPHGSLEELTLLANSLAREDVDVACPYLMHRGPGTDWSGEILSAIRRCDVLVALLYNSHPNVMFELGYALGGGKSVLLICESGSKIPFDVAAIPVLAIDRLDSRWISEAVEWVKHVTVRTRPAPRDFQSSHEMLRRMCDDESYLEEVEPRAFEECIANVLQEKGFRAELKSARNYNGFDIEIEDFVGK